MLARTRFLFLALVFFLSFANSAAFAAPVTITGTKNLSDLLKADPGLTFGDIGFGSGTLNVLAVDVSWGSTGTLGIAAGQNGRITVADGRTLAISGATHSGDGGAISIQGSSDFSITGAGRAVFVGNSAVGNGGAVYSSNALLAFNAGAVFSGNSATGSSGAIATGGVGADVTLGKGTVITGNKAGSGGGAITAYGKLTLQGDQYSSGLVTGNRANGSPDFAHIGRSLSVTVGASETLGAGNRGGVLDMRDPVAGLTSGANVAATKDGHGVWLLGGYNEFGKGSFTVKQGTVYLYRTGQVDNRPSVGVQAGDIYLPELGSSFTLQSGATLASGDGNTIMADRVTLAAGSILAFDLAHYRDGGTHSDPMLTLQSGTFVDNVGTVDLLSLAVNAGTYVLASTNASAFRGKNLTLRGEMADQTRMPDLGTFGVGKFLEFTQGNLLGSKKLAWVGSDSTKAWNATAEGNWKDGSTSIKFLHGDEVTFGNSASNKNVLVNAGGVAVGDMFVSDAAYTFTSEASGNVAGDSGIVIDKATSSMGSATGKLTIWNGASVDFTGITGVNRFTGGIAISGPNTETQDPSSLHLGNASHLGTTFKNVAIGPGYISFYFKKPSGATSQTYAFTGFSDAGDDANRVKGMVGSGNVLNLLTAKGVSVTFANLTAPGTENGGAVFSDGKLSFDESGGNDDDGAFLFVGNKANKGGALYSEGVFALYTNDSVFAGNSSLGGGEFDPAKGGAIYSKGTEFTIDAANIVFTGNSATGKGEGGAIYTAGKFDFTGDNAVFSGNKAGGTGYGTGGAIRADRLFFSGTNAVFSANTTGSDGGALYMAGDSEFSGGALFTGNSAYLGGAIFANSSLSLRATGGDITFSGNKANGKPNALHMGTANYTLTLRADKGKAIRFYDGISAIGATTVKMNTNSDDTGTVLFSGTGSASAITANTTVSYGTLALEKKAVYGDNATGSTFSLGSAATLKTDVSGNRVEAASISLADGSTLAFDLTGTVRQGVSGSTFNLMVDANTVNVVKNTLVRVYAVPNVIGTYGLIDSINSISLPSGSDFALYMGDDKTPYVSERNANSGYLMYGLAPQNSRKQLVLKVVDASTNTTHLEWNAGDGEWKHTPLGKTNRNWLGFVDSVAVNTYLNGDDVFFQQSPSGTHAVTVAPEGVSPKSMTFKVSTYAFTGGSISVAGGVTVHSTGTAVFSGGAVKAGGTVAVDGTLGLVASADRIALTAKNVQFAPGSTLNITGYKPGQIPNPYDGGKFSPVTLVSATDTLSALPGTVTVAGQTGVDFLSAIAYKENSSVKVAASLSWYSTNPSSKAHGDFTIVSGQNFELGAVLANNTSTNRRGGTDAWNGESLTKMGEGTLTLTAVNTYTGTTSVMGGTLALKGKGAIASSSLLRLTASGAGFDIAAATPASGEVAVAVLEGVSGSKVTLGANTLVVGAGNVNSTFAGVVSGPGGLGKTGSGTFTLSGSNIYSGLTSIRSGTLSGGAAMSFSSQSLHEVAGAATLDLGGYDQTVAGLAGSGKAALGSKTLTISNSAPVDAAVFTGALTGTGVFSVQKGGQTLADADLSGFNGAFAANAGADLLFTSSGALSLNKTLTGNGTVSLAAVQQGSAVSLGAGVGSAFTGTVNLQKGTMRLDANAGLALTGATLALANTNGRAVVVADRSIGGLALRGGELMIESLAASQWSRAGLLSVGDLAITHGKVMLQVLPSGGSVADQNFFDYAHEVGEQLVAASGTVDWDGTPLSLTDYAGDIVEHSEVSDILQDGLVAGKGYYGHMAKIAESGADKGISLVYSLTRIEALAGKTVILDSSDAQAAVPLLYAQLTGAGGFTFCGTQAVTVRNSTNNYTGPTIIRNTVSAGSNNALGQTSSLSLGANGRFNLAGYKQTVKALSGAGTIDLGDKSGLLDVRQNAGSTYSGKVTGSGTLRKTGAGILTLSGSTSKSVTTSVIGGGLIVSGQMDGSVEAQNAVIVVRGTVNGSASLVNSVTSVRGSLLGASSLTGGRLDILNGGRGGQIQVGKGASLGLAGSAFASSLVINSGGTLEAGEGGSAASLIMNKGATLKAMNGNMPLTISGAAVFSMGKGDIKAVLADGDWKEGQRYDILLAPEAGAADLYSLFNEQEISHLLYTGMFSVRNGLLSLYIEGNENFKGLGLTYNERHALAASMSLPKDSPVREAVWQLAALGSKRDLARAGDMLSGEMHADIMGATGALVRMYMPFTLGRLSSQSIVANKDRLRAMPSLLAGTREALRVTGAQGGGAIVDAYDQEAAARSGNFATASGGPDGYAFRDILGRSHSLWASVGGSYTSFGNTGGVADSKLYGPEVSGGYDLRTDENWLLGLGFRYGYKKFSVDTRDDDADINSYTFSLYGGKEWGAGPGIFRALMGGAYTLHTVDTSREVRLPTFRDSLEADYTAHSFQVFAEAAYAVKALEALVVEPYLSFAWNRNHTESFTERGGAARLHSSSRTHDNYTSYLGSRFHVPASDRFAFNLDLNWMHNFGGIAPKNVMRFARGGKQFSIKGTSISRDALGVGLSADVRISENVSVNIGYTGMFGERDQSHGGSATFTLHW
ncbi:autotransporter domain-containing protein [Desulfovibrio sp. OttesenSCG-928-G15]|nr:autotransporter domain-containing protein [Desulfovibrio sp. OttesenSCG-928-G15]